MILPWLALIAGCGLSDCRELCAREADCVEDELADFSSDWREWTGFDGREEFEDACVSVYEDSRDLGAGRAEMQRTCRAEAERPCGP